MRARFRKFKFPVFSNFEVRVEITDNIDKSFSSKKDLESLYDEVRTGSSEAMTVVPEENNQITYIFLPPSASWGTISHECYHAVTNMFEFVNADPDEETIAYHLGYLVDEVCRFAWRKR